jgi:hypothetical protein
MFMMNGGEATEGCLPAFLPVLIVTLLAISGMGTPLSRSAREDDPVAAGEWCDWQVGIDAGLAWGGVGDDLCRSAPDGSTHEHIQPHRSGLDERLTWSAGLVREETLPCPGRPGR